MAVPRLREQSVAHVRPWPLATAFRTGKARQIKDKIFPRIAISGKCIANAMPNQTGSKQITTHKHKKTRMKKEP
jgi:hypothetical protein